MPNFLPIYIRRSDGTLKYPAGRAGADKGEQKMIYNRPDPKYLDRTVGDDGSYNYYRELGQNDPKNIEWRRKLGGMLMRELGDSKDRSMFQTCHS